MTNEELIKRQEAIAVFMGWSRIQRGVSVFWSKDGYTISNADLRYDCSMNDLYPVCQKIIEMEGLDTELCEIQNCIQEHLFDGKNILEIFIHVSDFCLAFNEPQIKNESK